MSESIIVAIITGAFALIGTFLANRKSASLLEYRLQKLEEKVEEHNGYAKMFSENIPLIREQIKVANHRIEDLERK